MSSAAAFATTAGAVTPALPAVTAPSPAYPSASDAEERVWIDRALAGDQNAFAAIVERYQTAVYNLCYRMLGNPSEAEDAAQEVFVRCWSQLHTYQRERKFSTWLLSIASHWCIDLLRRRRQNSVPIEDVELWMEAHDQTPEEHLFQVEQREEVKQLLAALPPKYRNVAVLRYFRDLSYLEIADITGLSESAVKTQLHRARKMLADELQKRKGASLHALPSIS